jgi:DHA1 family multidrug resistance protein-like MFS transporter
MGLMTFVCTFASSVFSTATVATSGLFGVSTEVMTLGVSLYVLVRYSSPGIAKQLMMV